MRTASMLAALLMVAISVPGYAQQGSTSNSTGGSTTKGRGKRDAQRSSEQGAGSTAATPPIGTSSGANSVDTKGTGSAAPGDDHSRNNVGGGPSAGSAGTTSSGSGASRAGGSSSGNPGNQSSSQQPKGR